jgi:hypothetical protein
MNVLQPIGFSCEILGTLRYLALGYYQTVTENRKTNKDKGTNKWT